jgi:hypothetical protein
MGHATKQRQASISLNMNRAHEEIPIAVRSAKRLGPIIPEGHPPSALKEYVEDIDNLKGEFQLETSHPGVSCSLGKGPSAKPCPLHVSMAGASREISALATGAAHDGPVFCNREAQEICPF